MIFKNLIRKKRDGLRLTREELEFFARGLADASIPTEQVAAFAMAVFYRSMEPAETGALTAAMADSGLRLRWDELRDRGPVIDKHSTGGVGDKVSFLLAPIAAACGCFVPMISGRGLGHTGGTLDKLDAVPGYRSMPAVEDFRRVVSSGRVRHHRPGRTSWRRRIGASTPSGMSRRRWNRCRSSPRPFSRRRSRPGSMRWSWMSRPVRAPSCRRRRTRGARAQHHGRGRHAGLETHALVTDMSQTLGWTVGNALEIAEAVEFLNGGARESRLEEVVFSLVAEMLVMGRLAGDHAQARMLAEAAVRSGEAAQRFERMIAELGGTARPVDPLGPLSAARSDHRAHFSCAGRLCLGRRCPGGRQRTGRAGRWQTHCGRRARPGGRLE